ncbi:MAG: Mrp/NBP35 family ATP-binding protein [Candidatus Omnitrophica bacterium]|nr:Mrp/NBP35 family ATP-binding protein [Candidatus Omnitrophota bacterium]
MSHESLQEKIAEALKNVLDPELKRDIVALGMLKESAVRDGTVFVHLEITSDSDKIKNTLRGDITEKLMAIEGIQKVEVQMSKPFRSSPGGFSVQKQKPDITHVIAVASGKGGVGKTTVSVNLAVALARMGKKVGLMDGDIYGPNVPLMLGVAHETRPLVNDQDLLIPIEAQGIKMISMGILVPPDQPMVWRGPMLHSAVTQFIQKVEWGILDYLLVDLPPGTGDVQLSLAQSIQLSGAVIVTTPQEVALLDVRKGIAMFQKTNIPILGVIENMTGEIFGSGGGKKAAEQLGVPCLGSIALDGRIRKCGDAGVPVVAAEPESQTAADFKTAAETLEQQLLQAAGK